jgi:hypothetical protein
MSQKRAACGHTHWRILPGSVVQCAHCGETIEPEDLFDQSEPVHMESRWAGHQGNKHPGSEIQGLTHHLKMPTLD